MFNCNPLFKVGFRYKKQWALFNKRQGEQLTYYRKHLTQSIQQTKQKHQNWIKIKILYIL